MCEYCLKPSPFSYWWRLLSPDFEVAVLACPPFRLRRAASEHACKRWQSQLHALARPAVRALAITTCGESGSCTLLLCHAFYVRHEFFPCVIESRQSAPYIGSCRSCFIFSVPRPRPQCVAEAPVLCCRLRLRLGCDRCIVSGACWYSARICLSYATYANPFGASARAIQHL